MSKFKVIESAKEIDPGLAQSYIFFCEFLEEYKRTPTVQEVADNAEIVKSAAYHRLKGLVNLGLLEQEVDKRGYTIPNAIVILPKAYFVLKVVAEYEQE